MTSTKSYFRDFQEADENFGVVGLTNVLDHRGKKGRMVAATIGTKRSSKDLSFGFLVETPPSRTQVNIFAEKVDSREMPKDGNPMGATRKSTPSKTTFASHELQDYTIDADLTVSYSEDSQKENKTSKITPIKSSRLDEDYQNRAKKLLLHVTKEAKIPANMERSTPNTPTTSSIPIMFDDDEDWIPFEKPFEPSAGDHADVNDPLWSKFDPKLNATQSKVEKVEPKFEDLRDDNSFKDQILDCCQSDSVSVEVPHGQIEDEFLLKLKSNDLTGQIQLREVNGEDNIRQKSCNEGTQVKPTAELFAKSPKMEEASIVVDSGHISMQFPQGTPSQGGVDKAHLPSRIASKERHSLARTDVGVVHHHDDSAIHSARQKHKLQRTSNLKNPGISSNSSLLDNASAFEDSLNQNATGYEDVLDSMVETSSFHSSSVSTVTEEPHDLDSPIDKPLSKTEFKPLRVSKENVGLLNTFLKIAGPKIHSKNLTSREREGLFDKAVKNGIPEDFARDILDQTAGKGRWSDRPAVTLSASDSTVNSCASKRTTHTADSASQHTQYTKDSESIDYNSFRRFERRYNRKHGIEYGCIEDLKSSFWIESGGGFSPEKMFENLLTAIGDSVEEWRRQRRRRYQQQHTDGK